MAGPNGKRSLEEILEEHLEVTKLGFDRVNQTFAEVRLEMRDGFADVRAEMKAGFDRIDGRLENLLLTAGAKNIDHEARISALEADVAKLKAG